MRFPTRNKKKRFFIEYRKERLGAIRTVKLLQHSSTSDGMLMKFIEPRNSHELQSI